MDRDAQPAELVRALARTPARFRAVGGHLPASRLREPPAPGAWSPNEILWHVRAVADVYGEHVGRLLREEQPRWRHVSPRQRMKKARYDHLPFQESLETFERQRGQLVELLGGLEAAAWRRFALIRVAERESRLTLYERIRGMAHHEEIHCAQLELAAGELGAR